MFLEALRHDAVTSGRRVAWFSLESLGVLIRRHRADDSVTRAIGRILRADLVVVDLCRPRNYADPAQRGVRRQGPSELGGRHSYRSSRKASSESDGR